MQCKNPTNGNSRKSAAIQKFNLIVHEDCRQWTNNERALLRRFWCWTKINFWILNWLSIRAEKLFKLRLDRIIFAQLHYYFKTFNNSGRVSLNFIATNIPLNSTTGFWLELSISFLCNTLKIYLHTKSPPSSSLSCSTDKGMFIYFYFINNSL